MSTTEEERRHDLIEALRETIGHEQTGTLMGYLPPVGWADVATKTDLAHQDALLRAEIERLEIKMHTGFERLELRTDAVEHRFEARLHDEIRKQTLTMITVMTAIMAILVTVSSLF